MVLLLADCKGSFKDGRLQELKNKGGRLRELLITELYRKFKRGFTSVVAEGALSNMSRVTMQFEIIAFLPLFMIILVQPTSLCQRSVSVSLQQACQTPKSWSPRPLLHTPLLVVKSMMISLGQRSTRKFIFKALIAFLV